MLPGASGSRWMPRKMAGSAMRTMDPSRGAMNMAAVVLASATYLYRSSFFAVALADRSSGRGVDTPVFGPGSKRRFTSRNVDGIR